MGFLYTLRQFGKAPGFTLVAILTIALGIGATTGIFSYVNAWLIHPVTFPEQDRLVVLFESDKKTGNRSSVSPADWVDWQKSSVFEELAAATFADYNLTGPHDQSNDEPLKLSGYEVSANFFHTLGAQPALGRDFTESEMTPGQNHVVILSYQLWRDRFSSDRSILGRSMELDGVQSTVVGVMPATFQYIPMGLAQVFTPLSLTNEQRVARDNRFLRPVARLKTGADLRGATAAMTTLQSSLEAAYPATNTNRGVIVRTLQAEIDQQSGNGALNICFAIVWFVLLMACANVANLVMARATGRRKEIAIRLAIGASRAKLIRQLLAETVTLFLTGAVGGIFVARWMVSYLETLIPARSLPYLPHFGKVDVDWQTMLFAAGAALVTGIIFGLAPALEGSRVDLNTALKSSTGRDTSSAGGSRFRKILVAGEMALAVIVVVCGALLVNDFARMHKVDPGFDPRRALVAEMELPPKYSSTAMIAQFADAVAEKTAAIGGVERSAVAMYTPFSDNGNTTRLVVEGHSAPAAGQEPLARRNYVTPGFLESLNISLIAGRTIARNDTADSLPVAVINQTIANRYFAGENPLGQKIRLGAKPVSYTIVGIVKDIKYYNLTDPPENQVYLSYAQSPTRTLSLVARTAGDPTAIAQSMRAVVHSVDPNQPVSRIVTIETRMDETQAGTRILTQMIATFGLLALFLAAIGIYGVTAYSVSQRVREIGVRMALGASGSTVLALIVRQGMTIVIGGMIVGVAGAFAVSRMLSRFLGAIGSTDPATYAGSFAILMIAALLACWIPARRAARLNPVDALRSE